MKQFEHLNFEHRKIINNRIMTFGDTSAAIAKLLGCAISKEVKRNRFVSKEAARGIKDPICSKTLRFPYVCNKCRDKQSCHKKQYRYEAAKAQQAADFKLVAPRREINLSKEEFIKILP